MITLAECQICPILTHPTTRAHGDAQFSRGVGHFPMALGLRKPLTSRSPACVRSREKTPVKRGTKVPVSLVGFKHLFATSRLFRPGKRLPRRFPPSCHVAFSLYGGILKPFTQFPHFQRGFGSSSFSCHRPTAISFWCI